MTLYYAHYPSLEDAFVRFVRQRHTVQVDKWLVICASSLLARHLQQRLAHDLGAVANIHFVTAGALLNRLDQEAPGETLPLLPQDHVRDFLIKDILSEPGLDRYPLSRGFVQVVKSTLRDLADSLADPDVLEEHWRSLPDYVLQEDGGRFEWLIKLYKRYTQRENSIPGYRSYQQAFERALQQVESSAYLHSFSTHIMYGFYDMPGRQLELFSRLRSCYDVTVFAPYERHPAYAFAKKFFETNWLTAPGAQEVTQPQHTALAESASYLFSDSGSAPTNHVQIVSAPDIRGTVFYTAKEILKLIQQGHSLADIAIVARNLTPYQDILRQVFAENCLPLDASFSYPLYKYALGRFCSNVFELAASGFSREKVLAIFSSPYFKQPRKQQWRRLVSRSLVKRDLSQWNDLLPQQDPDAHDILQWVKQTAACLDQLNQPQPWSSGVQAALALLDSCLDVASFEGKDEQIYQQIREAISKIEVYQSIRTVCRTGELLQEILDALGTLTFHEAQSVRGGLTVTDVVRARGLRFKTVFVWGLNDREFPLLTPEDPILRDYYRFQLRDTLGYWINSSMDRGDEEKLLFYQAVSSAQEHLYVLYNRYTQQGKPTVPSVYVAELARACELSLQAQDAPRVSGQLAQQLLDCPVETLTPKELSYRIILHDVATAKDYYQQTGLLTFAKERALTAATYVRTKGPLGAYDGMIQSGSEVFAREHKKGFSPSALQEIASCPLKYFFNRVLHLAEPDPPASRENLPANKQGTAYHEVLREFYQTLVKDGQLHNMFDAGLIEYMQRILDHTYTVDSYKAFGIYPVIWKIILERINQRLSSFAVEDVKQLGDFSPAYFEQPFTLEPTQELPIRLRGIIDRIDIDELHKQFKIADYKSTRKGTTRLDKDFFTLLVFQPVIYVWMAQHMPQFKEYHAAGSCLLTIDLYNKRDLSMDAFNAVRPHAWKLLMLLMDFVKTGQFFMNPGEACAYCPYSLLCRKDAFHPLLRAQKSALSASLEEARRYDA